jgi:CheY-like chemotaxis protein
MPPGVEKTYPESNTSQIGNWRQKIAPALIEEYWPKAPSGGNCSMKKILIVEDQIEVRELIEVTLEIGDYQILSAENGRQALELAQAEHPDIILLDIMMPGSVDGLEVCRRLKADPATADITIVMLSAKGQEVDIEAGRQAGADAYFAKPFSPIALIEKIEAIGD